MNNGYYDFIEEYDLRAFSNTIVNIGIYECRQTTAIVFNTSDTSISISPSHTHAAKELSELNTDK